MTGMWGFFLEGLVPKNPHEDDTSAPSSEHNTFNGRWRPPCLWIDKKPRDGARDTLGIPEVLNSCYQGA